MDPVVVSSPELGDGPRQIGVSDDRSRVEPCQAFEPADAREIDSIASTNVSSITTWLSAKLDRTRAIAGEPSTPRGPTMKPTIPPKRRTTCGQGFSGLQQPTLVIGIDGGEYRERDQEPVIFAKDRFSAPHCPIWRK